MLAGRSLAWDDTQLEAFVKRIHALAASAIIGLSAVFGVAATTKSTGIGEPKPAASKVSDAEIAARQRKLNEAQKALQKARAQKPPALPAPPASAVSASAPASSPTRIVRTASAPRSFDDSHEDDRSDDHDEFEDEGDDD